MLRISTVWELWKRKSFNNYKDSEGNDPCWVFWLFFEESYILTWRKIWIMSMIRIDLYKKMDDVSSTYGILELSITLNWSLTRAEQYVQLHANIIRSWFAIWSVPWQIRYCSWTIRSHMFASERQGINYYHICLQSSSDIRLCPLIFLLTGSNWRIIFVLIEQQCLQRYQSYKKKAL